MAAGLGFKTFTTGEVLTAADTNGYLMQGVLVFASAAARDAAITSPQEGQCCYLKDTDAVLTYSGAAWVGFDDSNAIQNSIVDAKGDLISATADNTPARLAVGTNGQTLVADSSTATGLKWETPSAGGSTFSGWLIYKTAAQSIANNTSTFMTWESETYDTDGYHSTVTNTSRVTIPAGKAGKYLLVANLGWANGTTGERYVHIYKGGAAVAGADNSNARNSFGNSGVQTQRCITVLDLAETNYVEVRVVQSSGGSLNTTADECNFIGYLIGA